MRNYIFKSIVLIALLLTGLMPLHAMSLQEAVRLTLANHPELRAAEKGAEAARFAQERVEGQWYPRLTFEAEGGAEWRERRSTRRISRFWYGPYRVGARATQQLFDGFATTHKVRRQAHLSEAAHYAIDAQAELLALETALAYNEIARMQVLETLARSNLQYLRSMEEKSRKGVLQGVLSIADQQLAEARASAGAVALSEVKEALAKAQEQFKSLTGVVFRGTAGGGRLEAVASSLSQLITQVRRDNPYLKQLQQNAGAAEENIRVSEAGYYPEVDLELQSGLRENYDGRLGVDRGASASILMRWNVFDGPRRSSLYGQRVAEAGEKKYQFDAALRRLEERARAAYGQLQELQKQQRYLQQQVHSSMALRHSYTRQYSLGERQLLDVLEVQAQYFAAQVQAVSVRYAYQDLRYELLALSGALVEQLLGVQSRDLPSLRAQKSKGLAANERTGDATPALVRPPNEALAASLDEMQGVVTARRSFEKRRGDLREQDVHRLVRLPSKRVDDEKNETTSALQPLEMGHLEGQELKEHRDKKVILSENIGLNGDKHKKSPSPHVLAELPFETGEKAVASVAYGDGGDLASKYRAFASKPDDKGALALQKGFVRPTKSDRQTGIHRHAHTRATTRLIVMRQGEGARKAALGGWHGVQASFAWVLLPTLKSSELKQSTERLNALVKHGATRSPADSSRPTVAAARQERNRFSKQLNRIGASLILGENARSTVALPLVKPAGFRGELTRQVSTVMNAGQNFFKENRKRQRPARMLSSRLQVGRMAKTTGLYGNVAPIKSDQGHAFSTQSVIPRPKATGIKQGSNAQSAHKKSDFFIVGGAQQQEGEQARVQVKPKESYNSVGVVSSRPLQNPKGLVVAARSRQTFDKALEQLNSSWFIETSDRSGKGQILSQAVIPLPRVKPKGGSFKDLPITAVQAQHKAKKQRKGIWSHSKQN